MVHANLRDRLASLPQLSSIPIEELDWLVQHGRVEQFEAGDVVGQKGKRIDRLWIILSGHMAIWVDRGAGPRRVTEWRTGEVSGMLPYSRMSAPPGDNYLEERSELLTIHEGHFSEMISRCPVFTAYTVHSMLDRARSFNTSDLQDEKMISLGKLAAGLAHELNNPASATVRSARLLLENLAEAENTSRALAKSGLSEELFSTIEHLRSVCLAHPSDRTLSPVEQADRQDEIAAWLTRNHSDPAIAEVLADTAVTITSLDAIAQTLSGESLNAALRWVAASCSTHALAMEIVNAATRIYELVAAVKKFSYMDTLAGPELVDVGPGLRDTVRIMASKANGKGVRIALDVQKDLPRVLASGSELNQVWMNVIDNALDAVGADGSVEIRALEELNHVVVRIVDDGHGIAPELMSKIFDPFFTTKPPGHGTGLGLDISRRLLRRYYGDISFESQPGRTECRIHLPAADRQKTDTHDR